jgi:hypothetical protein
MMAQEKVLHSDGKTYHKISYENSGTRRIYEFAILFILTVGLVLFSPKFQREWNHRETDQVHCLSSISLEEHLLKRVLQAPSVNQLYQKALLKCKNIYVKTYSHGVTPHSLPEGSHGSANLTTGELTLLLGHGNEDSTLSTLVFELTNFLQADRFHAIDRKPCFADANAYAKANEQVEYDGMRIHSQAIQEAIITNNWNRSMDEYGRDLATDWKTFEDFWKYQGSHPHADHYRAFFNKHQHYFRSHFKRRSAAAA